MNPVLYILKSRSVALLPLLYRDIQAALFTTQQSKRLFTLITAGGVLGTTVGSLMTARLARWFGLNNLPVIYGGGMVLAAVLNELTEKVIKTRIETRIDRCKGKLEGRFGDHLREFVTKGPPINIAQIHDYHYRHTQHSVSRSGLPVQCRGGRPFCNQSDDPAS